MARASLADLLSTISPADKTAAAAAGESLTRGEEADFARQSESPVREGSEQRRPPVPAYLRFERKETRLRLDQLTALTEHARRLNKAKGTGHARITENTLIRIAVDLLLADIDRADGATEERIRRSLEY
jgi:hypothetical protein